MKKENFKYYVDVRMALRNSSNELWWDVYDDNTNDYMPPCIFNLCELKIDSKILNKI